VIAWRLPPVNNRLIEVGFGAVALWVAVSLLRFWSWSGREPARPDAVASSGVEYYRRELERRRDHLRNAWVWHGPLLLASFMLIAVVAGHAYWGVGRLWSVLPVGELLLLWTVFSLVRRLRLAKALQAEIDDLEGK